MSEIQGLYSYDVKPDGSVTLENYYSEEDQDMRLEDYSVPEQLSGRPVTALSGAVYSEMENLRSVTIGRTVREIFGNPFFGCHKLKEIKIHPENKSFKMVGNCLMTADGQTLICHLPGAEDSLCAVPEGTVIIGRDAFSYCANLTRILLPDSIQQMHEGAFYACENLQEINLPPAVSYIPEWAFSNCNRLPAFVIPSTVQSIGDFAFFDCLALTEIAFPETMEYIGDYAFSFCRHLKQIRPPQSVQGLGDNIFEGCSVEIQQFLAAHPIPISLPVDPPEQNAFEDKQKEIRSLIADCYRKSQQGDHDYAITVGHLALEKAKELQKSDFRTVDCKNELAYAYNNLAQAYSAAGQYEPAMFYAGIGVNIMMQLVRICHDADTVIRLAVSLRARAKIYIRAGLIELASCDEKLRKQLDHILGLPDQEHAGSIGEILGNKIMASQLKIKIDRKYAKKILGILYPVDYAEFDLIELEDKLKKNGADS